MTFHDDPDLERRLRHIAEEPKPPVPESVYRYAGEVARHKGGSRMRLSFRLGRGLFPLVSAVGVIGAIAVAVLVAGLVLSARSNLAAPQSPSPSASALPTIGPAPTASPADCAGPTPATPSATLIAAGFTTPGALSQWQGFSWSAVSSSSPLRSVTRVQRWSGGYLATAAYDPIGPTSGLWTSPDGQTWTPATAIDASAAFVSIAPGGLVAIAVDLGGPNTPGPVWTSSDGSVWHDAGKPNLHGALVSVAGTASGIIATVDITKGSGKQMTDTYLVEFSTDGVNWTTETIAPDVAWSTVPTVQSNGSRFFLMGGTASGLAHDGGQPRIVFTSSATHSYIWWSDDGRTWIRSGGTIPGFGGSIDFGRDGMLLNTVYGSTPGGVGLARSSDGGKTWIPDDNFGPLGVATCTGECSMWPAGEIRSNGTVFLAVKYGAFVKNGETNAWLSYDGHTWAPIQWAGGDPSMGNIVVLPRGVVAAEYGAAK